MCAEKFDANFFPQTTGNIVWEKGLILAVGSC